MYLYEAARTDSPQAVFSNISEALHHIEGSEADLTRPWLRLLAPGGEGGFLIVGGRKMLSDDASNCVVPKLGDEDQAAMNAWSFIPKGLQELLGQIDNGSDGSISLNDLNHGARQQLPLALARGNVVINMAPGEQAVVQRKCAVQNQESHTPGRAERQSC